MQIMRKAARVFEKISDMPPVFQGDGVARRDTGSYKGELVVSKGQGTRDKGQGTRKELNSTYGIVFAFSCPVFPVPCP